MVAILLISTGDFIGHHLPISVYKTLVLISDSVYLQKNLEEDLPRSF